MRDNQISQFIAWIVVVPGVSVMCEWIFKIPLRKGIMPQLGAVQFTSAVCFVAGGLILPSIREFFHQAVLPAALKTASGPAFFDLRSVFLMEKGR